jgi:hypothetical protein
VEAVTQNLRCCFCWRGPCSGNLGAHTSDKCNFLSAWNKKRAGANTKLAPIVVLEGSLEIPTARLELTIERFAAEFNKSNKELTGRVSAVEKRVTALEPKKKQRGNPSSTGNSTQTGKSTSSGTSGPAKKTRSKTKGTGGGTSATSSSGGQTAGGRGGKGQRKPRSGASGQ